MRVRNLSLGLKINLSLLLFLLLLGAATAAITIYGFHRSENNATSRSKSGLEDLARGSSMYFARSQSQLGVLQLEFASQIGQEASHYMIEANSLGATPGWDSSRLVQGVYGQLIDPSPDRRTDAYVPRTVPLNAATEADLHDSATLNALLPALTAKYPGLLRSDDFGALSIYFQSVNRVTRYYPPSGLLERVSPDLALTAGVDEAGPSLDPDRKTVWSAPRNDDLGQGLIMTAWTPVYEGPAYRGVIGVDLSLTKLVEQVNDSKSTPGSFSFYIDKNGVLLQSDSYNVMSQAMEAGDPALDNVIYNMKRAQYGVDRVTIDGKDVFVAYAPMGNIGGSFGVVAPVSEAVAQSAVIEGSIEKESNRTVAVTLVSMGLIFVMAMAVAGWLNRKVLLRPIEALASGTRAVASGDLDTQISVRGDDEMAVLAQSFNQMTADLRQRRDALRDEIAEREQAQDELQALFRAMTDTVLVIDKDGRYLSVPETQAPQRMVPLADITGKTMHEVMPKEQADAWLEPMLQAMIEKRTIVVEHSLTMNDRTMWFSAAVSPISEEAVVVVARDVTDRVLQRQQLELAVAERTQQLTTVLEVTRDVASTLELEPLLRTIIDQVRNLAPYDRSSILLTQGSDLLLFNSRVLGEDSVPDEQLSFPIATIQPIWERIGKQQPVIIEDFIGDSATAVAYRTALGEELITTALSEIRSWLGVPLVVKERVIGMLTLSSNTPAFYTEEHAELVTAIASQAAIGIENARLYEQAQQLAASEERQRLARELHDSVSQALYGIALGARTARTLLDRDAAQAVAPVDYVLSLAEAGLAEMRALIFELRPESLQIEGLVSALDKQIAATGARYGIAVSSALGEEPDVGLAVKEVFYRVGQEALHNVVKHARATRVDVRLSQEGGTLALEIVDDGIGFDSAGSFPGHMGLVSMSERSSSIRGRLNVVSAPGRGTAVRLEMRLPNVTAGTATTASTT